MKRTIYLLKKKKHEKPIKQEQKLPNVQVKNDS